MPFAHTVGTTYRTDAGTVVNSSESIVGNKNAGLDSQIMPGATDTFDILLSGPNLQSLMMSSDQPTTILTNDPQSPQDTITLKANVPLVWTINSWWPVPIGVVEVTKLLITNNGPVAANVKIRALAN
jgi:hypothetical protein